MRVIHFTEGATDPVQGFCAHGVRVVPLADGAGQDETYLSCLHFDPGGWIADPPVVRDTAILVVSGKVVLIGIEPVDMRLDLSPGVGITLNADEAYRMKSDTGAIILVVEAERLEATRGGISTPERIMGQLWPGESMPRRRAWLTVMRRISLPGALVVPGALVAPGATVVRYRSFGMATKTERREPVGTPASNEDVLTPAHSPHGVSAAIAPTGAMRFLGESILRGQV